MDFIFNLITGIPTIAYLIASGIFVLAGAYNIAFRTYVTYILRNPATGQLYIGRTSGFGEVERIVRKRLYNHDYYKDGFTEIEVDRAAQRKKGRRAIRGREQQLIDYYGGIEHPTIANKVMAVSKFNPRQNIYYSAAEELFGTLI